MKKIQLIREELLDIYQRLLEHFGPRHWWPADTPLEMIFGAFLTQNVSWKGASQAIANLKAQNLLALQAVLAVSHEELANLLRPARYYNQKAQRLKAFCEVIVKEYQGSLQRFLEEETASLRQRLLQIKGVGQETADAIILYAAQKPIFVIDVYTRRIFERLGYFKEPVSYRAMQEFFMNHLPLDTALFNEYHAQIDALGHHLCLKRKPLCQECPLRDRCRFVLSPSSGAVESF